MFPPMGSFSQGEKKILAENGLESEVRENASAILNDRPPFIKIDANWWIFIFICVSLSCSNENIFRKL